MKVANPNPAALTAGFSSPLPRKIQHYFPDRPDDRRMIAPAAQMISSSSLPANGQETTFSDDR
jgi:hypothetical protein